MAMLSAIQEARKDNLRSFNDHMMKVLEVTEAAAQAAVAAFHDAHTIESGHKSSDALTLDVVAVEESKTREAGILVNEEEYCVEDVISSITQVQELYNLQL